jgi:hypothetical protein
MTPEEFCRIESFESMTIKQLRKICQDFRQRPSTAHYFEEHSLRKDKHRLVNFLEQVQKKMRIYEGYETQTNK